MNTREHTVQTSSAKARLNDAHRAVVNFRELNKSYVLKHKMLSSKHIPILNLVESWLKLLCQDIK